MYGVNLKRMDVDALPELRAKSTGGLRNELAI